MPQDYQNPFALDLHDPRISDGKHTAAQVLALQEVEFGLGKFLDQVIGTRSAAFHTDEGLRLDVTRADDAKFELVAWECSGVHARPIADIAATGLQVTVRGLSLLRLPTNFPIPSNQLSPQTAAQVTIARSIDWLGAFRQLGVVLSTRPLVGVAPTQIARGDR